MSQREGTEGEIRARAVADDGFRRRLIEHPRQAVAEEFGIEIPESLTLRVIEEQADEVVLVIPVAQPIEDLRDAELEVAGGSNWGTAGGCSGDCSALGLPGGHRC